MTAYAGRQLRDAMAVRDGAAWAWPLQNSRGMSTTPALESIAVTLLADVSAGCHRPPPPPQPAAPPRRRRRIFCEPQESSTDVDVNVQLIGYGGTPQR